MRQGSIIENLPIHSCYTNLSQVLHAAAENSPDQKIIFQEGAELYELSYATLLDQACRILGGLQQRNVKPGEHIIFHIEKAREFVPIFWACVLGGIIPTMSCIPNQYHSETSELKKLLSAWQTLSQPRIAVGSGLVDKLSGFLKAAGQSCSCVFDVHSLDYSQRGACCEGSLNQVALLLQTSGSTGNPKLVQITHNNILSHGEGAIEYLGLTKDDRSLNWFALNYVGSLIMFHLRDTMLQCRQVHVSEKEIELEPMKCLYCLSKFSSTITWAPHNFYGIIAKQLNSQKKQNLDLSALRYTLNGGEQINFTQAKDFCDRLAPFGLKQNAMTFVWGMTETASASIFHRESLLQPQLFAVGTLSMGEPIPGFSAKVIDDSGQVVKEGCQGVLMVKGAQVTPGYCMNEEATRKAFDQDGWFDTGDLAVIREGQVAITGRSKDMIVVNADNIFCHEIEAALATMTNLRAEQVVAVSYRDDDDTTDSMAIFYRLDEGEKARTPCFVRPAYLSYGFTKVKVIDMGASHFPRTEIGKIQRTRLQQALKRREYVGIIQTQD